MDNDNLLHQRNKTLLLSYDPIQDKNVYMPRHHLYPSNPQILHALVVELFLRSAPHPKQASPFLSYVPYGPIYQVWGVLSTARKDIFHVHPLCRKLVLIAGELLPPDITAIVSDHDYLHTRFGVLPVGKNEYVWWVLQSQEVFAMYAKTIEAQLPFIRAYHQIDVICPYVLNTAKEQDVVNDFLDALFAHHGRDVYYVFIQPTSWEEKIKTWIKNEEL